VGARAHTVGGCHLVAHPLLDTALSEPGLGLRGAHRPELDVRQTLVSGPDGGGVQGTEMLVDGDQNEQVEPRPRNPPMRFSTHEGVPP